MNRQNIKIHVTIFHVMNSKQSYYLFICLCFNMYHLSDNFYINFRMIIELYIRYAWEVFWQFLHCTWHCRGRPACSWQRFHSLRRWLFPLLHVITVVSITQGCNQGAKFRRKGSNMSAKLMMLKWESNLIFNHMTNFIYKLYSYFLSTVEILFYVHIKL